MKDFSVQSNESKSQKCNRTSLKLDDLKAPPGNRLEALKGDYKGRHSIRINDQYRIVFKFVGSDAFDVEITD